MKKGIALLCALLLSTAALPQTTAFAAETTTAASGDLNADGEFSIADVVLLQKKLLTVPDTVLADWQAGDLCADGKLDAYVGKKIKMGIRPEDIDDEPEFMAKHTDCQLDAKVDVSEMMGAEIYLYLEYKGNKMTARVAPTSKARNGDTVRVAFDPHKVHVFDVETEQTILN